MVLVSWLFYFKVIKEKRTIGDLVCHYTMIVEKHPEPKRQKLFFLKILIVVSLHEYTGLLKKQ